MRKTIICVDGTEFAHHAIVEKMPGYKYFFARPRHSWERDFNENLNGLISSILHQINGFYSYSREHIKAIEWKLKNTITKEV